MKAGDFAARDLVIRGAAQRVAGGDPLAVGALLQHALPVAEGAVDAVLRIEDPRQHVLADEILERFLAKLADRDFAADVAKAESPARVVWVSAKNAAIDLLRKRPRRQPRAENLGTGEPTLQPEAPDPRVAHLREAIASLPADRRLLMVTYLASFQGVPAADVEAIARRRSVPAAQVRAELEKRLSLAGEELDEARQLLDHHSSQLVGLQDRQADLCQIIRARDGERVDPAPSVDGARLRTRSALEKASPADRSAVLGWIEARMEEEARHVRRLRDQIARGPLARPGYEEVASISGLLPLDATEEQKRRIVNTVTVTIKRVLLSLRATLSTEEAP